MKNRPWSLLAFIVSTKTSRPQQLKDSLFYYRDYALDGQITLGDKNIVPSSPTILPPAISGHRRKGPAPRIDRNNDGKV